MKKLFFLSYFFVLVAGYFLTQYTNSKSYKEGKIFDSLKEVAMTKNLNERR